MAMIRFGTDCSGIDAPLCALQGVIGEEGYEGVDYLFASERNKSLLASLRDASDTPPRRVYSDMTKRDNSDAPEVDLYVVGSPCQSFSTTGKRHGLNDNRGTVILSVISYIEEKQPKAFIIENVSNLLKHDNGNTWQVIWSRMSEKVLSLYSVEYKCISPHELGFPQTRKRVFIIGRHLTKLSSDDANIVFPWPCPSLSKDKVANQARAQLDRIFENSNEDELRETEPEVFRPLVDSHLRSLKNVFSLANKKNIYDDITNLPYIVRLGVSPSFIRTGTCGISPCLNQRCETFYIPCKSRYISSKEALQIQGFPSDYHHVKDFSSRKVFRAAGNAMHVGVMRQLICPLVRMIRRSEQEQPTDPQ